MMFPVALDMNHVKIALLGTGPAWERRQKMLQESGARHLAVFSEDNLPDKEDLRGYHIIMMVDMEEKHVKAITHYARTHNILVNVEDRKPYCDFYFQSFLRRGDLVMAVGTSGKSPALAKRIKQYLAALFPPIWAEHVAELASHRQTWQKQGDSFETIMTRSNTYIDKKEWLPTTHSIKKSY